ncbi:hypothetical protein HFN06_03415 [Rhizobium leguminosarum]|uniref:hypothetical protein n=1 Tax=Rhizobium TaxID=379 RepID=UPI0013B94FA8|nr:hypothetical protein [Rhizobium leguminosarum]MCA2430489.1 hypothetical protein [Rhizobium leguminosarum]NEH40373.1 hypothetical protein [Rhizobium leguminosarum]NEH69346.1 hypothetical protein [Rhizobium leguminosarum]
MPFRLFVALQQVGDDEVTPVDPATCADLEEILRRHGLQIVTARAEGTPMEYRLPLSEFA